MVECLYCGTDQPEGTSRCGNCGAVIMSAASEDRRQQNDSQWTILCPSCGRVHNVPEESSGIPECIFCADEVDRFRIARVLPKKRAMINVSPVESISCKPAGLTLYEVRKKKTIQLEGEGVISRTAGDIDSPLFINNPYVSEPHCRVFMEEGRWKVEDLQSLNKTAVSGVELYPFVAVPLKEGDYLRIADLFFKVSVNSVEVQSLNQESMVIPSEPEVKEEEWRIFCPVCGKEYRGKDSTFRVSECIGACSLDEFDRYEIARETARRVW